MTAAAPTTSTRTALIAGLAQYIADQGVAVWRPTGDYTADEIGIYDTVVPTTSAKLITLTPYGLGANAALSDSTDGVQVRTRWPGGDPRPVRDLDDALFNILHGLTNVDLASGVRIVSLTWTSGVSLGEQNQSWDWSSNYQAVIWRPSAHRQ